MDRPSQEPPDRPGPPADAESPLSFPVEAQRPEGVEPGAGSPLSFPVEVPPPTDVAPPGESFPVDASAPAPLAFPVEASRPADAPPPAEPLNYPVDASRSSAPAPLAFPAEAPRPAEAAPLNFPADASQPPGPAPMAPQPSLPAHFPVAQLPGLPAPPPATPPPAAQAAEAAQVAEPEPADPPAFLGLLPPVLTIFAALMAIGGLFLPLFRIQQQVSAGRRSFEAQLTITQDVWGSHIDIPGQEAADRAGAPVGIPLIIAIIVLFVAAFMAFSQPERGIGRWLVAAAAVFTAGVVTTIGMSRFEWSAIVGAEDLDIVTALGMWLLILAAVVAAVAAVVAYLPVWRGVTGDDWADPTLAYADTPTPPAGVAITLLPPDPEDDERP